MLNNVTMSDVLTNMGDADTRTLMYSLLWVMQTRTSKHNLNFHAQLLNKSDKVIKELVLH